MKCCSYVYHTKNAFSWPLRGGERIGSQKKLECELRDTLLK